MEKESVWKKLDTQGVKDAFSLSEKYKEFISSCKTERECCKRVVEEAKAAGYEPLSACIRDGAKLKPGDKVFATQHGKAVVLFQIGKAPFEQGMNILGAHIDSPRLDLKQNPIYEKDGLVLLDTHYYGGIKKYQWVTVPLALHGVVAKKDGSTVEVRIGEDPADPVFCVTDLLIHLSNKQMEKTASEAIEGEDLDVLAGNMLASEDQPGETTDDDGADGSKEDSKKDPVKEHLLKMLSEKLGVEEEDLLSAELEIVPAGPARDCGFDRSMVIGYGQDDRVCAYASLVAMLDMADEDLDRTAVCILVDKEEIGSVGATGMESLFFENAVSEVASLCGVSDALGVRRALAASTMLSSDVSAGVDPAYGSVFESKNSAYLGKGLVFNKYTGARGKSGSNDARAEYMAALREVMDREGVVFQTAELGRVDAGGGGTIAYIPARYGMDVIDSGVAVLSMHSPWEVSSKADIFEAKRGYSAFLRHMRSIG